MKYTSHKVQQERTQQSDIFYICQRTRRARHINIIRCFLPLCLSFFTLAQSEPQAVLQPALQGDKRNRHLQDRRQHHGQHHVLNKCTLLLCIHHVVAVGVRQKQQPTALLLSRANQHNIYAAYRRPQYCCLRRVATLYEEGTHY